MNTPRENIKRFFAEKLAVMAQVPLSAVTWNRFFELAGGRYGGRCTVQAIGWRVTQFDFTYDGKKYRFLKIS